MPKKKIRKIKIKGWGALEKNGRIAKNMDGASIYLQRIKPAVIKKGEWLKVVPVEITYKQ